MLVQSNLINISFRYLPLKPWYDNSKINDHIESYKIVNKRNSINCALQRICSRWTSNNRLHYNVKGEITGKYVQFANSIKSVDCIRATENHSYIVAALGYIYNNFCVAWWSNAFTYFVMETSYIILCLTKATCTSWNASNK